AHGRLTAARRDERPPGPLFLLRRAVYNLPSRPRGHHAEAEEVGNGRQRVPEALDPHPRRDAGSGQRATPRPRAIRRLAAGTDRGAASDAHRHRQDALTMATTPQPMGGGATEGWTLKQMGKEVPRTDPARKLLELAQRPAAQVGSATVEPGPVPAGI